MIHFCGGFIRSGITIQTLILTLFLTLLNCVVDMSNLFSCSLVNTSISSLLPPPRASKTDCQQRSLVNTIITNTKHSQGTSLKLYSSTLIATIRCLGLDTRKWAILVEVYKTAMVCHHSPCAQALFTPKLTSYYLRNSNELYILHLNRTKYGLRSFSAYGATLWNSLPCHIKSCGDIPLETVLKLVWEHGRT